MSPYELQQQQLLQFQQYQRALQAQQALEAPAMKQMRAQSGGASSQHGRRRGAFCNMSHACLKAYHFIVAAYLYAVKKCTCAFTHRVPLNESVYYMYTTTRMFPSWIVLPGK